MPAVACRSCKALVDTNDAFCKKCNEKHPFTCSKCEKDLMTHEVFEPEKLVLKKPVFCVTCGQDTSHVKCANCKTNLVKSSGRTRVGRKGEELVYHNDCWKTYELQVRIGNIIRVIVTPAIAVLLAILTYMQPEHSIFNTIAALIIGATVSMGISWVVSPKN